MAVHADRFMYVMPAFMNMLTAPLLLLACTALLLVIIGIPALAGIAVMLLYIPILRLLGRKQALTQQQKSTLADVRVKLFAELMQSMRVVKLYAWEKGTNEKELERKHG